MELILSKKGIHTDHSLLKYKALVETVDTKSFTKAAEKLGYAQSSISKMVVDLEQEFGTALLERQKGGVTLTSSGRVLLPQIRLLLEDHEKLQNSLMEMQGIQKGTIRIGTFASVAIHWLPAVFERFQKDYPGIDYEILLGDYRQVEQWVQEGRVDCGFTHLPVLEKCHEMSLKKDEYVVVLPPDHPLAQEAAVDIHKLEGQPFMLLEQGGKTEVSQLLLERKVNPRIVFTTWEDYAIMAMVEKGLGIGILPRMILQRIPYEIAIRPLTEPYYRQIGAIVKDRRRMSPAVKKFLEYVREYIVSEE